MFPFFRPEKFINNKINLDFYVLNRYYLFLIIDQKRWERVIKILDMVDENTTYGELYDIVKSGCH